MTDKNLNEVVLEDMWVQDQDQQGPNIKYGYRAGGIKFVVPDGGISELLQKVKIYHLPNAPKWVCGLINMHGHVVPVVDFVCMISNELPHLSGSNILSIKKDGSVIGVLIDGLPEAIVVNSNAEVSEIDTNLLPDIFRNHITDMMMCNGETWFELDIFTFLRELTLGHKDSATNARLN